jgi:hypothetical protein
MGVNPALTIASKTASSRRRFASAESRPAAITGRSASTTARNSATSVRAVGSRTAIVVDSFVNHFGSSATTRQSVRPIPQGPPLRVRTALSTRRRGTTQTTSLWATAARKLVRRWPAGEQNTPTERTRPVGDKAHYESGQGGCQDLVPELPASTGHRTSSLDPHQRQRHSRSGEPSRGGAPVLRSYRAHGRRSSRRADHQKSYALPCC